MAQTNWIQVGSAIGLCNFFGLPYHESLFTNNNIVVTQTKKPKFGGYMDAVVWKNWLKTNRGYSCRLKHDEQQLYKLGIIVVFPTIKQHKK
jgi:hypothetical protein